LIHALLVYDDWAFLNVMRWILEVQESDFRIDIAVCADEAILKLLEDRYDVVVSDCKVPGTEGLEFLSELKSRSSETSFVMFIGRDSEEIAVEALKNGADGCLIWDGDPSSQYTELGRLMRETVSRRGEYKKDEPISGCSIQSPDHPQTNRS